jgi:hypothetical protein
MRLQPELLQRVRQPAPPVCGLEGNLRARLQLLQDRSQVPGAVVEVAVGQLHPVPVQHGNLAALAVDIDPDVHHLRASLPELVLVAEPRLPEQGSEARPTYRQKRSGPQWSP